jgi:hypothetical protein
MKARIVVIDVFQNETAAAWADWSKSDLTAFRDGIGNILTSSDGDIKIVTAEGREVFMASNRVHSMALEFD